MENKYKRPTTTVCLLVILLLIFIICITILTIQQVAKIIDPLFNDNRDMQNEYVIESSYVNLEIVERGDTYIIYRDNYTDILYLELRSNGYSSSLTVIMDENGEPKKYSQE